MVLSWINGEPKPLYSPAPEHDPLPVIQLPTIDGDEFWTRTPPPLKVLAPLRIVKPRRIAPRVSPEVNDTTDPAPLPSMIVAAGPCSAATITALPRKLMFSTYVPGATSTVSPGAAAAIAC